MNARVRGWLLALRERWTQLVHGAASRRELDEEMSFHLERLTDKLVGQGMDPEAAVRAARQRFGARAVVREQVGDASGVRPLLDAAADLRLAARVLRRRAAYSAIAVATLAIGIGAITGALTVAEAVLVRPLPLQSPQELFVLWGTIDNADTRFGNASLPDLEDWRGATSAFEELAGFTDARVELGGGTEPDLVDVGRVTTAFFDVLRLAPVHGRLPSAGEFGPDAQQTVVTEGAWQRRFGGDPSVIGTTVRLGDRSYEIVGVGADPGLLLPETAEFWIPFGGDVHRGSRSLRAIARLREGATAATATQDLERVNQSLRSRFPHSNEGRSVRLLGLHEYLVGSTRQVLRLFLAATALVFLLTCLNTANLLYVGSAERLGELAVRRALGAGSGRLVRHVLAEALVLSALGGILGLALSAAALPRILARTAETLPRAQEIGTGTGSGFMALALALLASALVGLAPALRASRSSDPAGALRRVEAGSARSRAGDGMIAIQVALTFVLVFGAALTLRSMWTLQRVDPGLAPEGVATFRIDLPPTRYAGGPEVFSFHDELVAGLDAIGGVEHVGAVNVLPFAPGSLGDGYAVDGAAVADDAPAAQLRTVMGEYLAAVGIELRRGRAFDGSESVDSAPLAIVNDTLARDGWGNADPVGRTITIFGQTREVVGVVADVRGFGLDRPAVPTVYVPYLQRPSRFVTYAVRTGGEVSGLLRDIRATVARIDPELPLQAPTPLVEHVERSLGGYRGRAGLLGAMGVVALLLSTIGVYGVTAQIVAGRRFEIGVRLAMGATRAEIVRHFLGTGLARVVAGVLLGLVGAVALAGTLSAFVFGVTPLDPWVLLATAAMLLAVGVLGSWQPSRSASRVDPVRTLRE